MFLHAAHMRRLATRAAINQRIRLRIRFGRTHEAHGFERKRFLVSYRESMLPKAVVILLDLGCKKTRAPVKNRVVEVSGQLSGQWSVLPGCPK